MLRQLARSALIVALGFSAVQAAEVRTERLDLFSGDTFVLDVDALRVAVGNGRVTSVTQVDGRKLLVLGEAPGVSAVHVWTRDGSHRRFVINVLEFNGEAMYEQVQRLLAGTHQIGARLAGDRIVLEGHRVSETDRERVAAILKAYPGRVFDFIDRVGWDAMIHMQVSILEIRHSALDSLGVRWDNALQGPTVGVNSSGAEGRHGYLEWTAQLSSTIDLLRQRGEARVVAEPTLSCRSGGVAHFVAGGELPIPVTNGQGSPSVQYREYGVILDVKPAADDAGNIYARVETEVSDVDRSVQVLGVPAILKRHSNTEVNVRAGETIVIAGLVNRSSSGDRRGLPGLSALPGIAPLFQSRSRQSQDSELIVFITPRIVAARPAGAGGSDPGLQQLERADQLLQGAGKK
jgi:pilus assembly protein CpaC